MPVRKRGRKTPKPFGIIEQFDTNWVGLDTVILRIKAVTDTIEGKTRGGLVAAALRVKNTAIKLTPVDTGNLRNSAYIVSGVGGKTFHKPSGEEGQFSGDDAGRVSNDYKRMINRPRAAKAGEPFAEIGYAANYALWVHENLDASHIKIDVGKGGRKTRVQAGQAKFLERALMLNRREIKKQIISRAKI